MLEWSRGSFTVDGAGLGHTVQNLFNAVSSMLTQVGWEVPAWSVSTTDRYFVRSDHGTSDVWHYTGDFAGNQRCGIRITISGNNLLIRTFLENAGQTDAQTTQTIHAVTIGFQATAPNNGLVIAGEDGLYIEYGRDGQPTNLGHGFIGTFREDPSLYGTLNSRRKYYSQGFTFDLTGSLALSSARNTYPMRCGDGTNRLFTTNLFPYLARGMDADIASDITAVNNVFIGLGNRQVLLALCAYGNNGNPVDIGAPYTLGTLYPGVDARYSVSPLVVVHGNTLTTLPRNAGSTSSSPGFIQSVSANAVFATGAAYSVRDYREDRIVPRFAAIDYTIIPFANITDTVTSKVYRVARVPDGGRAANIGVEWPTDIKTITV